ncbi:2,3-bisphosphoglycerate-independent phosphoglycerate mutase, partial [Listeria monocytogenes]|nr:2,3-bisphosphoglycerate-independent phosphoglycerate mutase [Listeria monocytogenes]
DKRWERVEKAYKAIVSAEAEKFEDPSELLNASYANDKNDEFVVPAIITKDGKPVASVKDNDAVIFFNFRPDRAIQLSNPFTDKEWDHFDRGANHPK